MLKTLLKAVLPESLLNALRRWRLATARAAAPADETSAEYWTRHHVPVPDGGFTSVEQSLDHLKRRNAMYPGTDALLPVTGADGLAVLDYGCGPGNDVVGFCHFSRPAAMHALDVSSTALAIAEARARLHGFDVDFQQIAESPPELPFAASTFDLIHSAGVLHHTPDPLAILGELRRVLKPRGRAQLMVYNRDSLWMHLHVAYRTLLQQNLYPGLDKEQAFGRTTDGDLCPIANCYRPEEFVALCRDAGFDATFAGAGISLLERDCLALRDEALADARLDTESRAFLEALDLGDPEWPRYRGRVAGINGCYHLRPA